MVAPLKPWVVRLKSSRAWFFSRPTWSFASFQNSCFWLPDPFLCQTVVLSGQGVPSEAWRAHLMCTGEEHTPTGIYLLPHGGGALGWIMTPNALLMKSERNTIKTYGCTHTNWSRRYKLGRPSFSRELHQMVFISLYVAPKNILEIYSSFLIKYRC